MTLFCNGSVILPEHVVFPPDLESHSAAMNNAQTASMPDGENQPPENHADFSLDSAIKRHVRLVYERSNRSQRRAAKVLGISRSTLARYLQAAVKK
jgi:transcriptional regulator with PAS, ATPase and Fis domain